MSRSTGKGIAARLRTCSLLVPVVDAVGRPEHRARRTIGALGQVRVLELMDGGVVERILVYLTGD